MNQKRKNGFTLIELLAVIVILAIIALIAVPVILNIIDKANKSAFKDTAYGVISAGELFYAENQLEPQGMLSDVTITLPDERIPLKGKVPEGQVKVTRDGKIAIAVKNNRYCITKGLDDTDVTVTENPETCELPGGNGSDIAKLEGDGQTFHKMAPSTLAFRSSAPLSEFKEVKVNGVTVDPANYTLTEGSTIVTLSIDYLKTLDVTEHTITVVSKSGASSAGFEVIEPDLNEHGFYYNQPYTAYVDYFGATNAFFIREDGTADSIVIGSGTESVTYTVSGNQITANSSMGTLHGTVSDDGTEIYIAELATTYKLGDESIVADEDYIYIYDSSLGGYSVTAIDKTKASYSAIKTGINGKPTVALAGEAFRNNENLVVAPKIPDSVTIIGDHAFANCDGLESITIPDNTTSIGDYAFNGCSSLTSVTIPSGVRSLGIFSFSHCSRLESVTLPDNNTSFGQHAFSDCTALTSIIVPDNVTSLSDSLFYGCSNLSSVTLGSGLTNLGASVFIDCPALTNIKYNGTVDQWNAIETNWLYLTDGLPATEVVCSDGTVALN